MKNARLFKTIRFNYTPDAGIRIRMQDSIILPCKLDNFASQVTIQNTAVSVDPFQYKYITFDGHALFEITDCIKSYDVVVFFIQYLTDVDMGNNDTLAGAPAWDSHFFMTGKTPKTYEGLKYSSNKLSQIFRQVAEYETTYRTVTSNIAWGIRITYSNIPQNLFVYDMDGDPGMPGVKKINNPCRIANPTQPNNGTPTLSNYNNYNEQYTIIMPLPGLRLTAIYRDDTHAQTITHQLDINLTEDNFISCLPLMINDLTTSVDLIPINNVISAFSYKDSNSISLLTKTGTRLTISAIFKQTTPAYFDGLIVTAEARTDASAANPQYYPCFFCQAQGYIDYNSRNVGIGLLYDFCPITLEKPVAYNYHEDDTMFVVLRFFGNQIDLSQTEGNRELYIQPLHKGVRLWLNYAKRNYIDIATTLEFTYTAYSNYEAYKKANIDMLYQQKRETMELQHDLQEEQLAVESAFNMGTSTMKGAASGAASGGVIGAVVGAAGGLISSGIDAAKGAQSQILQEQNDKANLNLAYKHALQTASATIMPGSQVSGSISLNDLKTLYYGNSNFITVDILPVTYEQQIIIYKTAMREKTLDAVNYNQGGGYVEDLARPEWIPAGKPSWYFFDGLAAENRKSFYLMGVWENDIV